MTPDRYTARQRAIYRAASRACDEAVENMPRGPARREALDEIAARCRAELAALDRDRDAALARREARAALPVLDLDWRVTWWEAIEDALASGWTPEPDHRAP